MLQRAFKIADGRVHQDPNDENTRGKLEMAGYPLASILRHSDPRRRSRFTTTRFGIWPKSRAIRMCSFIRRARWPAPAIRCGSWAARRKPVRRLEAAFKILLELKMYPADEIGLGTGAHRALAAQADYEAATGNVARARSQTLPGIAGPDRPGQAGTGKQSGRRDGPVGHLRGMAAVERQAGHVPSWRRRLDARRLDLWRGWEKKLPRQRVCSFGQIALTALLTPDPGQFLTQPCLRQPRCRRTMWTEMESASEDSSAVMPPK